MYVFPIIVIWSIFSFANHVLPPPILKDEGLLQQQPRLQQHTKVVGMTTNSTETIHWKDKYHRAEDSTSRDDIPTNATIVDRQRPHGDSSVTTDATNSSAVFSSRNVEDRSIPSQRDLSWSDIAAAMNTPTTSTTATTTTTTTEVVLDPTDYGLPIQAEFVQGDGNGARFQMITDGQVVRFDIFLTPSQFDITRRRRKRQLRRG